MKVGATRYERVAALIEDQVQRGALRVGDRVPSVRSLSRHQRVSVGTVLEAYVRLEARGLLEARPRSGFYVRVPHVDRPPEPRFRARAAAPAPVGPAAVIVSVMEAAGNARVVPLGAACPSPELLPYRALNRFLRVAIARNPTHSSRYESSRGSEALRRQIARRALLSGCEIAPADVIVTCGAIEALQLCLRAVTRPGQLVALESPTYFGILQVLEALGLRAVEIPTHPRDGLDLGRLAAALRTHRIAACVAMPTLQNPLGAAMPLAAKRELVTLLARHGVPLIEDDVYGDLVYGATRPPAARSFDRKGLVLYCSSFSKTLGPGFRVGWVDAGRFTTEVDRLKFMSTVATASLPQVVIAHFLERGAYERHLRRLRAAFQAQTLRMSAAIARHFPAGTRISRPAGGFVLWVELPEGADAVALHRRALAESISISPGPIFSAAGRFQRMLRINCGHPWSPQIERAAATLGRLAG
jgi:DNA-binding transcriptional MocR family regulator